MTTDTPIRARALHKRFGHFTALDSVDLDVQAGTVHGFLGPNGAGKSTTIRVLLGMYRRDGGEVSVLGLDPQTHPAEVTRQVSYVPGDVSLQPNLTGRQTLDLLARLRGARDAAREAELIERFALDPSKKVRSYSTGNRQKVMLVAAFAAPTPLLVLDEPTAGLDPLMERVFGECIAEAAAAGRTVLLSSHLLPEVDRLCSAVSIIADGRIVETGSLARLRELAAMELTVHDIPERLAALARQLERHVEHAAVDGDQLHAEVVHDHLPGALRILADAGSTDVQVTPASLESLFLRHYDVQAR